MTADVPEAPLMRPFDTGHLAVNNCIVPDGRLFMPKSKGLPYIDYFPGEKTAQLQGFFSAEYLEAIARYMRHCRQEPA